MFEQYFEYRDGKLYWKDKTVPTASINIGESLSMTATVKLTDGKTDTDINWVSSNSSVAKVNSKGQIQAIKKGIAVITAVSVNDASKNTSIIINDIRLSSSSI